MDYRILLLLVVLGSHLLGFCKAEVISFQSFRFKKSSAPEAIDEGGQSVYTVFMDGPPDDAVTLELETAVDGYIRTLNERLIFNSTNWNDTREIVIVGVDDDIIRYSPYGGILNINSTSSNKTYNAAGELTLLIADTDESGVVIRRKEVYPSPVNVPEGRWVIYEVSLPSKPTNHVTITFQSLSRSIKLSPTFMLFEPEDWNSPQDLLVNTLEDDVNLVSPYSASFNMSLSSEDFNFDEKRVPDVTLNIEDNDEDEGVISGSLVWNRLNSSYPRTMAEFHLSLTLSSLLYFDKGEGDEMIMPGRLLFGDETLAENVYLIVEYESELDNNLLARAAVMHEYSTANHFGDPWEAVYEYCCRSGHLRNNRKTRLALSVLVDLNYHGSPLVPALPIVHWKTRSSLQQAYYIGIAPDEQPLYYSLGSAIDYRSALAGSPQGVAISAMTGHLTWDTTNVNEGDYSLQIVTQDLQTGLRVAAEIFLRLADVPPDSLVPIFQHLSNYFNLDTIYGSPGSTVSSALKIADGGNTSDLYVIPLTPFPKEFDTQFGLVNDTVYLNLSWTIPSNFKEGSVIVCGAIVEDSGQVSAPTCSIFKVLQSLVQDFYIDFNGASTDGYLNNLSYRHGEDQSVSILSNETIFSFEGTIVHATVFFASYFDGVNETLELVDFNHPSLKVQYVSVSPRAPQVLYVSGSAAVSIYKSALQHVTYKNTKGRPSIGKRVIGIQCYTGLNANILFDSYINIDVTIVNMPPSVKVNGDLDSFENRFYPGNPPVSIINSEHGSFSDSDSKSIHKATVELGNALNGANELLTVTYLTPEALTVPIVEEELDINVPFGKLFSGVSLKSISHTLFVKEEGVVGDVDVIVDIRHSWIGDLKLELEHADRIVLLVLSPGGPACSKDNLFSTTFDTDSSDNVELSKSQTSPGLCQFQTQGMFTTDESLQSFKGDPFEGEWTLHVTDILSEEDSGRLLSWGLVIQPNENHLIISSPAVVPDLTVGGEYPFTEQHKRLVEADGRIMDISVHIDLGISFGSDHLYLPTLKLVHPDGTEILLSDANNPLCAYGNYTHIIFDDRASLMEEYTDYSCQRLYNSSDVVEDEEYTSGFSADHSSGSGSGSGLGSGSGSSAVVVSLEPGSEGLLNIFDLIDMNVSIPAKLSLIDVVSPNSNLSMLRGKRLNGIWTLEMSSDYFLESTLLGWSIKVGREPNIDIVYDTASSTLTLQGEDSAANYQAVLRTVHYANSLDVPNFSETRVFETVLYDGEEYSNASLPGSLSFITIHHVVIDLDPLDISEAAAPNFATAFIEHSPPIPVLDQNSALLSDPASQSGLYTLLITLRTYNNYDLEGLTVNTTLFPEISVHEYTKELGDDETVLVVNVSALSPQSILSFQSILRSTIYFNDAEELIGTFRNIEFVLLDHIDGNLFTSETAVTKVTLIVSNDAPVLILNLHSPEVPFVVQYTERQGEVNLTSPQGLNLTDNDDDTIASVTIKITNAMDGEDEILSVSETVLNGTSIASSYNYSTNTLTLSGVDTLENYVHILSTVIYENAKHSPGDPDPTTRVVTFIPNDGKSDGLVNVTMISFTSVNDAPFGDLNGLFVEGRNTTVIFREELEPVKLLAPNAVLFDVDNNTLDHITVQIINALDGKLEELSVKNVSENAPNSNYKQVIINRYFPEANYNYQTSTLTIRGLESIYEYQQVLRTLTYVNKADEPHPETRIVRVVMNDGLVDSEPLYSHVMIYLINDSPFVNKIAMPFKTEIDEDISDDNNLGFAVSEIAHLILDDDVDSVPGIAVTVADTRNGTWEYSLNNGLSWEVVLSNVSLTHALLLSASDSSEARLRFVPDRDINGLSTLSFVPWDASDSSIEGFYVNANSVSGIDAFGIESLEVTVIISPVNDAPVLTSIPLKLTSILEDEYNSVGDTVLSLLEYASDVDIPLQQNELGIAVIMADQDNGIWQYTENSGENWTDFGNISEEYALLLRSLPEIDHRIRFVPNKNYNGYDEIRFLIWDLTYAGLLGNEVEVTIFDGSADVQEGEVDGIELVLNNSGSASGSVLGSGSGSASGSGFGIGSRIGSGLDSGMGSGTNTSENITGSGYNNATELPLPRYVNSTLSDAITGPLSVNSTTATLRTEPVNDSPTVVDNMSMKPINEDLQREVNHGTQVTDIIKGYYHDVDAYPMKGLAIVEVDNRYGEWQFTCTSPNETSWQKFIGNRLYGYDVPPLPLVEKATLLLDSCWIRFLPEVHFNTEFDYDHNRRPSSDTPYIVAYGWDNTGLTEELSGSYGNDASYANNSITNEYSFNSVTIPIAVKTRNDIPILWLTSEPISSYETIFYEDLLSVPVVGDGLLLEDHDHARLRKVVITIYGEFDDSPFDATDLNDFITDIIPDEMFSGSSSSSGSSPGSGEIPELSNLQILQDFVKSKEDPTYLELYCAGLQERTERLLIDILYTDLVAEIFSFCPFQMLIYPDPDKEIVDADKAMFQKVLRTVQYNNSVQEPLGGERTVSFVVYDDFGHSIPVNTTIDVILINDAPILDLNDYVPDINNFVTYFEGDSPLVLVNSSGLRLVDFDNQYLQSATVTLVEAPDTINETLTAETDGTNIIADYVNYTLYLTGNDTVEAYASVLSTLTYYNNYSNPGNPDQRDREVIFVVYDGDKESLPAQTTISFYGINDKPSIDVNGDAFGSNYTLQFREEEGPVLVTSSFTILVDQDNDTLEYVTATILNPLDGILETLSVNSALLQKLKTNNPLSAPNVTYNHTSSTLRISGLSSVGDYKMLVKTIVYNNEADEFVDTTRIIRFVASDGILESNPAYTAVEMVPINDSPYFNDQSVIVPHIYEDPSNNEGTSVFDIAYDLIVDHDVQYMTISKGIAVTEAESHNGEWQYRTESVSNWTVISPDTNMSNALLLNASDSTLVRFVPNKDFNGNVSLSFVAWDGVDGMPEGIQRVATSESDTDPFSDEKRVLTIVVVPVNDAPVLNTSKTIVFSNILEDDVLERPSLGEDVSVFFSALMRDVDQDETDHEFGVAITEADQSSGYWQISTDAGVLWKNISEPSPSGAIVLHSKPSGYHRIRFAPFRNFNGDVLVRFKLWDLNVTRPSGTEGVDTLTDEVTGTFSKDTGTATLVVEPVNDSPVLAPGPRLAETFEDVLDIAPPAGTYVSQIVDGLYGDVDENSVLGIAVVGVDSRYGTWQYTCDSVLAKTNWYLFYGGYIFGQLAPRLPNSQRATLLLGNCRIRFLPDRDFNTEYDLNGDPRPESDIPYLMIRGWDNTGDTEDMNMEIGVDTTSVPDDHTNSFSRDTQNATIIVTSVNDRPRVLIDGVATEFNVTYTEPLTPNRTVIPVAPVDSVNFEIVDVDNARLEFAQVSFIPYNAENETLIINTTGTGLSFTTETIGKLYRLVLYPTVGDSSAVENFNMALRTLKYKNTAEEPDSTVRELVFTARDEFRSSSKASETMVIIKLVNDPPEIDLNTELNDTYNLVSYSEGQGPTLLVDPSLSLVDHDNTSLDHVIITISNILDGENEILSADPESTDVNVSYTDNTLFVQGPATVEEFIQTLKTLTYNNTLSHPGNPSTDTRIIEVTANDGLDNSFTATVFLYFTAINNLPILDVNGKAEPRFDYTTEFVEDYIPVPAVAFDMTLIDVDNDTLEYVKVVLENPLDGTSERLWVDNVTEYQELADQKYLVCEYHPNQHYDYNTSVLTITGLNTVYEYQQVLRTLKYDNKADEPHMDTRVIEFQVSDGISVRRNVRTMIEIISVNDSPFINVSVALYHPLTYEDITREDNIGWSLDDMASRMILDDDLDSISGIAVIGVDTTNGHWEYTTDYNEKDESSESGSDSGSGTDSGSSFDSGSGSSSDSGFGSSFGSGAIDALLLALGMDTSGSGSPDSEVPSTSWYPIPDNSSLQYATVLQLNSSYSRIRFVPDRNFNGNVTISFVAWDTTDGLKDGTTTDATSESDMDPFSSTSFTLTATVEPVNDAPLLNVTTIINMTGILEDNINSVGDEIALYVSGISDVDVTDKVFGIAVTFVNDKDGSWEFSTDGGATWQALTVSVNTATLLTSVPSQMNRIRFVPSRDYNGYANLMFVAWDLSSGGTSGTENVDTASFSPVTGPFSVTKAQAMIFMEPVNDSPVIEEGMQLKTLYEDIPVSENNGTLVKDIATGFYKDVDENSQVGFAVVGVNKENGLWEYWCPDWTDWREFIGDFIYGVIVPPLPLPERATILSGNCKIRFIPDPLFNTYEDLNGDPRPYSDIPYIQIRGWDNTGTTKGLSGHYGIDTTHNNESIINELSSDTVGVLVYIDSVNNPTVLNISSEGDRKTLNLLFTEDDPFIRIVEPAAVSVGDVDNSTLESVTVEITNVHDPGSEWIDFIPLNGTDEVVVNSTIDMVTVNTSGGVEQLKLLYNIHNSTEPGSSNLTLVAYDKSAEVSKEGFEEALRHLIYINRHPEPANTTRLVIFHVNDGVDVESNVFTYIEYRLLAENHPVLTTHLYNILFIEGEPSPVPLVSDELTLTDKDHNEFFYISQVRITILPTPVSVDERVSVNTSVVPETFSVAQYYNETTGQLLVYGDAPVTVYEDLLRTAEYHNTIEEPLPGTRNISVMVTDSHKLNSNVEYVAVSVGVINDRHPVITTADEPFYYMEHHVRSTPMETPIHENLSISDPDSGDLLQQWIEIELTNPLNGLEYEVLNATENSEVTVEYTNGVLNLSGPALVSSFQEVLSTLTYINTAEEPIFNKRVIAITAFDGLFYSSVENISVLVVLLNDPPVIDLNGDRIDINYITEYVEGEVPIAIVNSTELVVSDNDDSGLSQIVIELENIFDDKKEILAVDEDVLADNSTINVSYSLNDGMLRLVGEGSLDEYLKLLRTATYNNLEAKPGNPNTTMRRIIFTAYDMMHNSSVPAVTYLTFAAVNDAPFLDLNGNEPGQDYSTEFIEEGEPVLLSDANITIEDIDSETLEEVRIEIVNCLDGDMEEVALYNESSLPTTLSWLTTTCKLSITGYGSVEDFQTAIGLVTYQNFADEPSFDDRIIKFIVNDRNDDSEPRYTNISISPVNDPPRLQISAPPGVYNASDFYISDNPGNEMILDNDMDPGSGSGDDSFGSGSESGETLASGSGHSGMKPVYLEPVSTDNSTTSASTTSDVKIYITDTIFNTQYTENGPSVPIVQSNFVTVEDDDDTIVEGLEVVLENEQDIGFETVFFSESTLNMIPEPDIRVALMLNPKINPYIKSGCPTGSEHFPLLNITLQLTKRQMVYLIKSLHYCNTDNHPVGGDRNITFRVRDPSGDWSNIETTTVNVVAINDAPIFNTTIPFEDEITIDEDHNITIAVLHLFYDFEEELVGNSIRVIGVEPDIGTTETDPVTGDITYYSALNDYGVRVVSYIACDSLDNCSPVQNLTIIIEPVNDIPYPIGNLTLELTEDVTKHVNLTIYFGDVEDDASGNMSYPKASFEDSSLTLIDALIVDNGYGGLLTVTSRNNTVGTDLLNLEVCDSDGACITVPLTIIIDPVNDPPEIAVNYLPGFNYSSTVEDTAINISLTFYDIESTLSTPIAGRVVNHGNGTVTINKVVGGASIVPDTNSVIYRRGNLQQEMYVTYTPDTNFYGPDVITVSANDSEGGYTEQSVSVSVEYINDPPHFGITVVTTDEDVPLEIVLPSDLAVTDPEDVLHAGSFSITRNPDHGTLSYNYNTTYYNATNQYPATGSLLYVPDNEYFSTTVNPEYFSIQACDHDVVVPDNRLCTTANITVVVRSTNDPPIVPVYTVEIDEDHSFTDNIWQKTTDVEDTIPPVDQLRIIEPFVENGKANYDNKTGYITYVPNGDYFGEEYIYFESCDSEGYCNTSGLITVRVLDINDPPTAEHFTTEVREDTFELIDIEMYSSDLEDESVNLKISIVNPRTGGYASELVIPSGASLRVYQAHGIITYEPPPDFVGIDSFTYAICDSCDVRRNSELGRTNLEDYPQCTKQLAENGNNRNKTGENVDITCDEGVVTITIINTNDVPIVKDISGRTFQGNTLVLNPLKASQVVYNGQMYYSNASAVVYDPDDNQTIEAQINSQDLNKFQLRASSDIDTQSLVVRADTITSGIVTVNISDDGVAYIVYTPKDGFSGYERFNYEVCDLPTETEPPKCSEAEVQIFVTRPGPNISRLTAYGQKSDGLDTDSKVSKGDRIVIEFGEDTNMPPHHLVNMSVSADEIDSIFEFPKGFIPPPLYANRYTGLWLNRNTFEINIVDEGYPQPENKIDEWNVRVKDIDSNLCGGIDSFGNRVIADDRCLLSSDTYSSHSDATSPPLEGNWGLRLPDLTTILIKNIAVEDDTRIGASDQSLFPNTQISLILAQPFSHNQLVLYCTQDPNNILNPEAIGRDVIMVLTGCGNLLLNEDNAFNRYSEQIQRSKEYFDVLEFLPSNRKKRQTTSVTVTEQPVVSTVTLQIQSFTSITVDPVRNPTEFTRSIKQGLNRTTMVEVISQLSGVNSSLLVSYDGEIPSGVRPIVGYYPEKDDDLTPKVSEITGNDPDCLHTDYGVGDTMSIQFNKDTDQPIVTTKADIDKILVITPPIGTDYSGYWETPSKLVIKIESIATTTAVSTTTIFSLSFTSNYLSDDTVFNESNANLPTTKPQCYGINVCGTGGPTIGVCSANGLSCRAYEPISEIILEFDGGNKCEAVVTSRDWLWVLLAVFVLIVFVIFFLTGYYCYRKQKQKRQKEEAIRVVERWQKGRFVPKGKDNTKEDATAPWAKPPDVFTMRDQPDPFSEGPLKNLPEMAKRPPTAAAAENLPPLDTIPTSFIPRAGARIAPSIPLLQPLALRDDTTERARNASTLPSLTPLGLPRINRPFLPAISPTEQRPTLAPLKGPLHIYARQTGGPQSPSPQTLSGGGLPGVLRPTTLPPLSGVSGGQPPVLSRRISGLQPPALPGIRETVSRPFINKISPFTSSDENVTSTSDVETEGTTTSDGGGVKPLPRRISMPLPRPLVPRPSVGGTAPNLPRNLSIGSMPLPPIGQLGAPLSPMGARQSVPPTMAPRKPSIDPFSTTSPRSLVTSPRPLMTPPTRPLAGRLPVGPSLRAPPLPAISPIKEEKDSEDNKT